MHRPFWRLLLGGRQQRQQLRHRAQGHRGVTVLAGAAAEVLGLRSSGTMPCQAAKLRVMAQ